ncbi:MAG: copper chaperone PCu(A)C [Candidatus Thiodiazotropha sp.]
MSLLRIRMLFGWGLLLLSSAVLAGTAGDGVSVEAPYVRAVPPGQPNSAAFMSLHNSTDQSYQLVGASSDVAEVVELHTHTMEDGMMRMRQVDQIELPAGDTVSLKPGGLHIMLIGLKHKLVPDDDIRLTLKFSDGSEQEVSAPVKKIRMTMGGMGGH